MSASRVSRVMRRRYGRARGAGEGGGISRPFHGPARAQERHARAAIALGLARDHIANVQARQRIRLLRRIQRDVGGIVRANEKIAARVGQALAGAHEMGVHRRQIARIISRERRRHRQYGKRDLGMLMRTHRARALALASRQEPFGIVVLEAGVLRLPVVATTACGVAMLLEPEREVLTVPPEDAAKLANALERLVSDDALSGRLGAALHARIWADFTWERIVSQYLFCPDPRPSSP